MKRRVKMLNNDKVLKSNKLPKFANSQKGTVLITVVLIAAFVIILVVEAAKIVTYQKQLSSNLINRDQAYSYLMGMEELAKIWLKKAFENTKEETVHLNQSWAQDDITFPLDGGGMTATIRDMQSCFNLNTIAVANSGGGQGGKDSNPKDGGTGGTPNNADGFDSVTGAANETPGQKILGQLIRKLNDKSEISGDALATAVRDWVDEDIIEAGPDGAEDAYYQSLEFPYRTANGLMAHESELRGIKDFNQQIYMLIRPHVCVLPDKSVNQINVNTVTPESAALLFAVIDSGTKSNRSITMADINSAISNRPEDGYEKIEDFFAEFGENQQSIGNSAKGMLDIKSSYFQMSAKAEIGKTRVAMKTLFKKDDENNFKVVSRYFGRE